MRRLAIGALFGAFALASPADFASSGAATRHPAQPARTASPARPVAPDQPSADDDRRAMKQAQVDVAAREARVRATQRAARTASRAAQRRTPAGDGAWEALAMCESNGNPRAVSRSGKYRGAFQFSIPTWRSLGYGGDPIDHPYSEQLQAAKRLQARSGWQQWPACARRLGLL